METVTTAKRMPAASDRTVVWEEIVLCLPCVRQIAGRIATVAKKAHCTDLKSNKRNGERPLEFKARFNPAIESNKMGNKARERIAINCIPALVKSLIASGRVTTLSANAVTQAV